MRTSLLALLFLSMSFSVCFAEIIDITVQPQGDGVGGKERSGYGYPWENIAFDSSANPNSALHWYDAPYGQSLYTNLQVALSGLPSADNITGAYLYINLTALSGSGVLANVSHASDSSAATGNASDSISTNEAVGAITDAASLGWYSINVTDFVKNDVQNGYSWSVFSFASPGYTTVQFSSGDGTNAPYLQVQTVPEPGVLTLLLLFGLGLVYRRRMAVGVKR
jgi:hypothetical protein